MSTQTQTQNPATAPAVEQPQTTLPSVSVFGGAHWASSPSQVCFFAMLLAMEQQMKAANAYAQYQEDIWDPEKGTNGMSMMTSMFKAEYDNTIDAANDQARATVDTAIESACNAGLSGVSAVATGAMGSEEVEKAQGEVNNATGSQKEMQEAIDTGRSTTTMGDRDGTDAETQNTLKDLEARDFRQPKPAGQDGHLSPDEKAALGVADRDTQNAHLKTVKEDVNKAYDRLNAAEMDRQRKAQFVSSLTQMAQGASQAACRGAQSIEQAKQGQDQADAQAGRMGKENFDKMLQTDIEANQSAKNNASQMLQILAQMEKGA